MRCDDVQKKLMDFIDGRLPEDRAHAFKAHMEACPVCREAYADEIEMVAAFGREISETVGDDFVFGVMDRIDSVSKARVPAGEERFVFRFPVAAKVLAVLVVAGLAIPLLAGFGSAEGNLLQSTFNQLAKAIGESLGGLKGFFDGCIESGTDLYRDTWSEVFSFTGGHVPLIVVITALGLAACTGLVWKYRKNIAEELTRI
jgi:hypothetical protein